MADLPGRARVLMVCTVAACGRLPLDHSDSAPSCFSVPALNRCTFTLLSPLDSACCLMPWPGRVPAGSHGQKSTIHILHPAKGRGPSGLPKLGRADNTFRPEPCQYPARYAEQLVDNLPVRPYRKRHWFHPVSGGKDLRQNSELVHRPFHPGQHLSESGKMMPHAHVERPFVWPKVPHGLVRLFSRQIRLQGVDGDAQALRGRRVVPVVELQGPDRDAPFVPEPDHERPHRPQPARRGRRAGGAAGALGGGAGPVGSHCVWVAGIRSLLPRSPVPRARHRRPGYHLPARSNPDARATAPPGICRPAPPRSLARRPLRTRPSGRGAP